MFSNLKEDPNSYALIYPTKPEKRNEILNKLSILPKIPNE